MTGRSRRVGVVAAGVGLTVLVAGAGASAMHDANVIHGCQDARTGALRVSEICRANESAIQWNMQGPQGPRGMQGEPGGATAPFAEPGETEFVVAEGVDSLLVRLWGAGGGAGHPDERGWGSAGSGGAYLEALLAVTAGETLRVKVGGGGPVAQEGWYAGGTGEQTEILRGTEVLATAQGGVGGLSGCDPGSSASQAGGSTSGTLLALGRGSLGRIAQCDEPPHPRAGGAGYLNGPGAGGAGALFFGGHGTGPQPGQDGFALITQAG